MIETIVVATDGSDNGTRAVKFAAEAAARYGAGLVILHVLLRDHLDEGLRRFGEVEHLPGTEGPGMAEIMERIPRGEFPKTLIPVQAAQSGDEVLTAVADQVLRAAEAEAHENGVESVRKVIEDGKASRCILEVAEKENADLIVLGSRGLSGLAELFLGSVSHRIVQLAPCAVTIVP